MAKSRAGLYSIASPAESEDSRYCSTDPPRMPPSDQRVRNSILRVPPSFELRRSISRARDGAHHVDAWMPQDSADTDSPCSAPHFTYASGGHAPTCPV